MNIVTVVKYKVKDGYVDDFIKAINEYDYSKALSMRLISTSDNEFISIMEYDKIDKTGDDEVDGVDWLGTVEHMLEFYGESRTDSCSGLVLAAYDQAKSWKWYQALSKSKVGSVQELAAQEKTTVETITRNLPLAILKPDQVEKLLKGQHAPDLSVAQLLKAPSLL